MKAWTSLPLFDAAESQRRAADGIERAANGKASLVVEARSIAIEIAKREGLVTADDVVAEMCRRGYGVHVLGSAAGAIFRDKRFEFTGVRTKSTRIHSHQNELKIWRLAK